MSQDTRLKRPLANRRTGGPRTAEGRARSSLNAIKHGGYVSAISAAQEFQATFSELVSRINPVGVVEEGVVNSLAVELFRLSMLGKLELERVQSAIHSEVSIFELAHRSPRLGHRPGRFTRPQPMGWHGRQGTRP